MKPSLLIPVLTIAVGLAARAQSPNIAPPPGPPQGGGAGQHGSPGQQNDDRRERFHKMAEQFRQHRAPGGGSGPQAESQERAAHIREAMKHLRAAGLGQIAERIEGMLKKMHDGSGPRVAPSGRPQADQPQRPTGPWQHPGSGNAFSAPAPFMPPMQQKHESRPHSPQGTISAPQARGDDHELRAQVQQLTRQVEELRNSLRNRPTEYQSGPRGGDNQGRRPQGDQPQAKPRGGDNNQESRPPGDEPKRRPSDGPNRERHDAPPQPKRDGAEEIKPALIPQSGSIE